jgi:hypothetical protein
MKQDGQTVAFILFFIIALVLLAYSIYLALHSQWSAATYFLVCAYAISPWKG